MERLSRERVSVHPNAAGRPPARMTPAMVSALPGRDEAPLHALIKAWERKRQSDAESLLAAAELERAFEACLSVGLRVELADGWPKPVGDPPTYPESLRG